MTKSLQNQFVHEFDYSALLKGRNNYPTELFPDTYADECRNQISKGTCTFCPNVCAYETAKNNAAVSDLAVLNLDYLLLTCTRTGSPFGNRDLCIIDECDELESKLMDFVSVSISEKQQLRLGIFPPEVKTYEAKNSFSNWKEWTSEAMRKVAKYRATLRDAKPRTILYYKRLYDKLSAIHNSITSTSSNWIYVYDSKGKDTSITFKPILVRDTAKSALFDYQDRFLFMSATIVAPDIEAENLGLEREEYGVVTVPSTFPPENRPIYPVPVGSMAFKSREETTPKVLQAIQQVLRKHESDRVIIHTHTAYLAKQLAGGLRKRCDRSVFTYEGAGERDSALHSYKLVEGSVLVAMSMSRGIDLPDDLCRVQIICLLPRMPITDQQINYRMFRTKGGRAWYDLFTIRSLVQSTGRGVRNKDDYATTYILDSQFLDFHRHNSRFFPPWWNESVDWSGRVAREINGN